MCWEGHKYLCVPACGCGNGLPDPISHQLFHLPRKVRSTHPRVLCRHTHSKCKDATAKQHKTLGGPGSVSLGSQQQPSKKGKMDGHEFRSRAGKWIYHREEAETTPVKGNLLPECSVWLQWCCLRSTHPQGAGRGKCKGKLSKGEELPLQLQSGTYWCLQPHIQAFLLISRMQSMDQ